MKKTLALLLLTAIAGQTFAQSVDTLNTNNIFAVFNAGGDLFYDVNNFGGTINSPGSPLSFTAGNLWIGGYDTNGKLHMSAQTYRQTGNDFWPGPLDTINAVCSATQSAAFNKVWKLNCSQIDTFYQNFTAPIPGYSTPVNITTWPAIGSSAANQSQILAPFVDQNADGNYQTAAGDYPLIRGTQSLYYVYNDSLENTAHTNTTGARFGIQIEAMPYAYNYQWDTALMNTIFVHYTITNFSTWAYHGTRIGFWYDFDTQQVNYEASDSINKVSIHYDANSATGIYFLNQTMDGCINYQNNPSVQGNPITSQDYYELLNFQWDPNTPMTYGGLGINTGNPTQWMYTGNPVTQTGWRDAAFAIDYRTVAVTDSFTLQPGQKKEFDVAISFAYDSVTTNGSFTTVRQFYATNQGYCVQPFTGIAETEDKNIGIYPNPTTGTFTLSGTQAGTPFFITDVTGKTVQSGVTTSENTMIDVSTLNSGLYFVRVATDAAITTIELVISQ
jgi:Secretion system C-terminal sorting domain